MSRFPSQVVKALSLWSLAWACGNQHLTKTTTTNSPNQNTNDTEAMVAGTCWSEAVDETAKPLFVLGSVTVLAVLVALIAAMKVLSIPKNRSGFWLVVFIFWVYCVANDVHAIN